jgi:hypothetical protein
MSYFDKIINEQGYYGVKQPADIAQKTRDFFKLDKRDQKEYQQGKYYYLNLMGYFGSVEIEKALGYFIDYTKALKKSKNPEIAAEETKPSEENPEPDNVDPYAVEVAPEEEEEQTFKTIKPFNPDGSISNFDSWVNVITNAVIAATRSDHGVDPIHILERNLKAQVRVPESICSRTMKKLLNEDSSKTPANREPKSNVYYQRQRGGIYQEPTIRIGRTPSEEELLGVVRISQDQVQTFHNDVAKFFMKRMAQILVYLTPEEWQKTKANHGLLLKPIVTAIGVAGIIALLAKELAATGGSYKSVRP